MESASQRLRALIVSSLRTPGEFGSRSVILLPRLMKPALVRLLLVSALLLNLWSAASAVDAPLHWLEGTPVLGGGVSFGVPWARGAMTTAQSVVLSGADGKSLPVQTWPLAYWPDGSVKWTGVATVVNAGSAGPFQIHPGVGNAIDGAKVSVRKTATAIEIDTGKMICRVGLSGPN